MIARIWHGITAVAKADAYMQYFHKTGLAEYQATEGNKGVVVLRKDEDGQTHFLMITFWESEDAIRKFAGEDINQAKFYPDDNLYFTELEPTAAHYDVLINQTVPGSLKLR